jgi:hypothetical protein
MSQKRSELNGSFYNDRFTQGLALLRCFSGNCIFEQILSGFFHVEAAVVEPWVGSYLINSGALASIVRE